MSDIKKVKDFYKNKKVLITGHTGFKGTWLCQIMKSCGARVVGYALEAPTNLSLFMLTNMEKDMQSYTGDIRDLKQLREVFDKEQPEIVIHMAAQPIVRESYRDPVTTYETNVMGTVNVLECVRQTPSVKSVINVTTDKVYRNNEWDQGYVEADVLDGYDPYSNSKSCSELVTHSYVQSFLAGQGVAVSTCRAGNVIGGGDFAKDRIIPDCVRVAKMLMDDKNERSKIVIRNPYSTRPYQHVLEPLFVYLLIAMRQYEDGKFADCYNVGPDDDNCITTGEMADLFCRIWNQDADMPHIEWKNEHDGGPHEAGFLKLNCTKLKKTMGWNPMWTIEDAVQRVIEFEKVRLCKKSNPEELVTCMDQQIQDYLKTL